MPTPSPLAIESAIPDKDGAIKFGGGAGDSATIILTVYAADLASVMPQLLDLRGHRMITTFMKVEDIARIKRSQEHDA